jgi:hypothetical protein
MGRRIVPVATETEEAKERRRRRKEAEKLDKAHILNSTLYSNFILEMMLWH